MAKVKIERRAKGSGSIMKRTDGRWTAKVRIGEKQKTKICKTKTEASKALIPLQEALEKSIRYNESGLGKNTLKTEISAFLDYKQNDLWAKVTPATYARMERTWNKIQRENKTLSKTPLTNITAEQIQKIIERGYHEGLSHSSVKKLHDAFSGLYRYEIESGKLPPSENPMLKVKMIPAKAWGYGNIAGVKTDKDIYSKEELNRLIEYCKITNEEGIPIHRYAPLLLLILNTGVRCGEALALSWKDIQGGAIHINKTVVRVNGKTTIQNHPKTNSSIRYVPINAEAREALEMISVIFPPQSHKPIVYTQKGNIIHQNYLLKKFNQIIKGAGLDKKGGLHILRDCFATYTLDGGANLQTVARLLGHTDTRVTERYYISIVPDTARKAVEGIF